jgi:hypothetical protein
MHVGGTFCDLAKVYGCANHEILLSEQSFYGIGGIAG